MAALVGIVLLLGLVARPASAQVASIQGTIVDNTGGVLPGVAVLALHVDTGTTQETVTNTEGRFFFQGVRLGAYELTAVLPGFATLQRTGVTVQAGQTVTIDLEMRVAALEEAITVTGEAPLINLVESKIGGNLNIKAMDDTPLNGRQWMTMTQVAPGARGSGGTAFGMGNAPQFGSGTSRTKVNVDGGQVNSGSNNDGVGMDFSQDAIQEVEVLSNRFGAQHARAGGGVLNAITKSGSNNPAGTFYGFFRNDALNSQDFFTGAVRPFKDTQVGGTIGGPIRQDRFFYFFSWESERQPQDQIIKTGIPVLDVPYQTDILRDVGMLKLDYQINNNQRLSERTSFTRFTRLIDNPPIHHIDSAVKGPNLGTSATVQHTWTSRRNWLNDITVQYLNFDRPRVPTTLGKSPGATFPFLDFPAADFGARQNAITIKDEHIFQLKDDFSVIVSGLGGEHNLQTGAEYYYQGIGKSWGVQEFGNYRFNRNPTNWAAVKAVVEAGDRQGLQNLLNTGVISAPTNFTQGLGDPFYWVKIYTWGTYIQDDWRVNDRLTLNLGIRYDIEVGALQEDITTRFLSRPDMQGRPNSDTDNWQPRFGFVFALDERNRSLVRGGVGRYYDQSYANQHSQYMQHWNGDDWFIANLLYDGSADFLSNPFVKYGGPNCTSAILLGIDPLECRDAMIARGVPTDVRAVAPTWEINYTDQYSIGLQHQLTNSLAVQADYVRMNGRDENYTRNINLWVDCGNGQKGTYPGTWPGPECVGETLPVRTFGRPDPRFGVTTVNYSDGRSKYDALQVSVTKRLSRGHQYQLSYILSKTDDSGGSIISNGYPIAYQYGTSGNDERHRLTTIGSLQLPWDSQFSGVLFYTSGSAYGWTSGQDLDGDLSFNDRALAPDGSRLERNPGRGDPVLRVDMRFMKQFRLQNGLAFQGMIEFFNVFNRENYVSYTGNQRSLVFGQPTPTENLQYQPRMGQVAFRVNW